MFVVTNPFVLALLTTHAQCAHQPLPPQFVVKNDTLYRFVPVAPTAAASMQTEVEPVGPVYCDDVCCKSLVLAPHFYLGYHRGRVLGAASIKQVINRWKNLPFFSPASDATDEEIYRVAKRMFISENLVYFSCDLLESAAIEWATASSLTVLSSANYRYPAWMSGNPRMTAYAMGIAVGYIYEVKGKQVATKITQWSKDKLTKIVSWGKKRPVEQKTNK